jgi:tRNA G18 (ribose-2'-O)-methylase SpoU
MRKLAHEKIRRVDPSEISSIKRHPVCVLLENIRSAHNVGAILRSADGALAAEVILGGITPDGNHKGVNKSALGAQEFVPWRRCDDAVSAVRSLKTEGYTVVALELTDTPTTSNDLTSEDFPLCLVVGNEVTGISDDLLAECDLALEIPQYGAKQSLNVSVALGIALFDVVRRYRSLAAR